MSSAGYPQTDGRTERANRVVGDVLRTVAAPNQWSEQLPAVKFARNNSVHTSTVRRRFILTDCAILGRSLVCVQPES